MTKIDLTEEMIDKCFENKERQFEYWEALYKIAFPNWDKIEKIDGYPRVSEKTWHYICNKCIDFDQKHHPINVMAGGLWMNRGFSSDMTKKEKIPNWKIDISEVKVKLIEVK